MGVVHFLECLLSEVPLYSMLLVNREDYLEGYLIMQTLFKKCFVLDLGDDVMANHISALIVEVGLNTLWSHPSDWDFLVSTITSIKTMVISAIHVLCQSKISHFDHSITINPMYWGDKTINVHSCLCRDISSVSNAINIIVGTHIGIHQQLNKCKNHLMK